MYVNGNWHGASLDKWLKNVVLELFGHFLTSKNLNLISLDITCGKHKVYWENDLLGFSGIPFILANRRVYACHHGKDKMKTTKDKMKKKRQILMVNFPFCRLLPIFLFQKKLLWLRTNLDIRNL